MRTNRGAAWLVWAMAWAMVVATMTVARHCMVEVTTAAVVKVVAAVVVVVVVVAVVAVVVVVEVA